MQLVHALHYRNVGGCILKPSAVTLYLFGGARHGFRIPGAQVPDRRHHLDRVLRLVQQRVKANGEREVGSAIRRETEVVWNVLHEHDAERITRLRECRGSPRDRVCSYVSAIII